MHQYFYKKSIYIVHDNKPSNNEFYYPQFFSRIFLSFSNWKRKQTFQYIVQNWKKLFGTNKKCLFSFSTAETEKNSW